MNDTQRNEIQRLRQAGMGYVKIAQTLTLSANTVKAYCRRNGLAGARITEENANLCASYAQAEDKVGHAGRNHLISSENRVNSSVAEGAETVEITGFSAAQPSPKVNLVFAEEADEKVVDEVLGMLMRDSYCNE